MEPLYVDLFPLAQKVLITSWVLVFIGVVGLGSVLPSLLSRLGLFSTRTARVRGVCRLAAVAVCAAGWALVPDTFSVEGRSADAFVQVACSAEGDASWRCVDGTTYHEASPVMPGAEGTLYRLAFSGLTVHFERNSR